MKLREDRPRGAAGCASRRYAAVGVATSAIEQCGAQARTVC